MTSLTSPTSLAGGGCTSTILYWMSADLWPGATKGSLEWNGRWKATHYEAKRGFLNAFLVSMWSVPLNASMTAAVAPFGLTVSAHAPVSLQGGVPAGLVRISCWSWAIGHLGDVDTMLVIPKWPIAWGGTASSMLAAGTPLKLSSILRSQALINDSFSPHHRRCH